MTLTVYRHSDEADDIPQGLDALVDALAQLTLPSEAAALEMRYHGSVMWRCYTLTEKAARHIPSGPIPRFFVVAQALCRARRQELTAALRQASRGVSFGTGREGKTDANGRDGSTEGRQREWGHDQAPDRVGNEGGEALSSGAIPDSRWLMA